MKKTQEKQLEIVSKATALIDHSLQALQHDLEVLAIAASVSAMDTVGKLRRTAAFIRANWVGLKGTANQCLIKGGFHKTAASRLISVAVDTTAEEFETFMSKDGSYRLALKEASTQAEPDKTPRKKEAKKGKGKLKLPYDDHFMSLIGKLVNASHVCKAQKKSRVAFPYLHQGKEVHISVAFVAAQS